ncbi:low-density lipoprotein receptor-related protein 4-like isoform X3 [Pomacea canaliculata]|uniref:low-density lipoprotein receptor-related protein 4-like isoform X3 n=1 Tax=Pomacea canaliculata TaxID=400727 RepID=UPI000D733989|nr:low-density lipoprotein receptor-related protein 4-like isoform X3 [Pomacea canaliculata]
MRAIAAAFLLWTTLYTSHGDGSVCSSCPSRLFACGNCVCIPQHWVCDGDDDCEDSSDEEGSICEAPHTCPEKDFTCHNGECINQSWLCDGDNDCGDSSDEIACAPRNCTTEEFRCSNGNCVPTEWSCDGDDDCTDGSDEAHEHCTPDKCSNVEFRCRDGSCIKKSWVCDRERDCQDGSDEDSCNREDRLLCRPDEMKCWSSGRCILRRNQCDGSNDCGDWEDELGCGCQEGEFNCTSGFCINGSWRCDGDKDCEDGSDELNCDVKRCGRGQFRCDTGMQCIDKRHKCDGTKDCLDGSDELSCVKKECSFGQFQCNNKRCIGIHKLCNGHSECGDGSDELHCDTEPDQGCETGRGGCAHECIPTKSGSRCQCRVGYQLTKEKKECEDVDECKSEGTCSQICRNTLGSFQCDCVSNYTLKLDGRGCKALGGEAYLIFANRVDIRRVTTDKTEYTSILQGLHNAIAVDFHLQQQLIFWSDVTLDKIKRAYMNGSNIQEIITEGLESPGGLAVDWIHNKLFWTDAGTRRIEVSNLDGRYRKVIIWQGLEKPRAIAAHPGKGTLFWTDWGNTPKIERAGMDGSLRTVIANTSVFWPNGLTLDYASERLYWADAKHHVIESAALDGSNRRIVINQGLPHPFALTLFEDELYWTDWYTKSINKANKFSGQPLETVRTELHYPMDIHTLHPQRQPAAENKCLESGCSHLCLPNEHSYTCTCPTGLQLTSDKQTCSQQVSSFLLFATQKDVRRLALDSSELADVVIPLTNVSSVVGVEYDSASDTVYWTDVELDIIGRAHWDGSMEQVVVGTSLESPAGLAVDWAGQNLYWTDAGNDRIEVSRLDGTLRSVLLWQDLDQPRDIVVDPRSGWMFWSDLGKQPRIERAGMDGLDRMTLVSSNLTWPNGLAIDYEKSRLYWMDAGHKVIESCNFEGRDRKQTLIGFELKHPFGLTIYGETLYWTDWETHSIHVANKETGAQHSVLLSNVNNLMDLEVFHRHRYKVPTVCRTNNGGCSHLCLVAPLPRGHNCACPTGVLMSEDGVTCEKEMSNFLIFTRQQDIRRISLEVEYYADVVVAGSLKNAIAIDVDVVEGKMYWTDTVDDKISRANLNGSNIEVVVSDGLHTPDGLAIDSVGHKIYWTDDGHNRIEVANLDGSMRSVLVWQDLDKPRALALHYDEGHMFWTDWGGSPRIERADMDGKNRAVIIKENLMWPNGLTIDRPTNRIIWADAKTETIECADLSGHYRRKLVERVAHPYGLTAAGNSLYWTDWQGSAIFRADKTTGGNTTKIRDHLHGVMDIHAVQVNGVQTYINRCGKNNGGCSHLCLPSPGGVSCACPTGLLLQPDQKTCNTVPREYLLFSGRGSIRRISLDTPDHTDVYLPIPDLHNVIAVDFDYLEGMIYYTDIQLDVIRRATLNGSGWMETVVSKDLVTTDGLAVDWIARNLYWMDSGRDVIEVARLTGSCRKTIVDKDLDEPRAIAVFPVKGLLFWTDWGTKAKIERAFLDGTQREPLVTTGLGFPNALSIDYEAERLYWVDAKLDKIETSDLNGLHRVTLLQQVPHPFGLTLFGDFIYWTDWQTEKIERASKHDGMGRTLIQSRLEGLMDIHLVSSLRQTGSNLCSINNGGCTHLCFAHPDTFVCACPNIPDGKPCLTVPASSSDDISEYPYPEMTHKDMMGSSEGCSEYKGRAGLCHPKSPQNENSSAASEAGVYGAFVALGVIIFLILICAFTVFLIWRRHRRRRYNIEELTTLTYANPSYQKTSTETINSHSDQRSLHSWGTLHFRSSQEKLTVMVPDGESVLSGETTALVVHNRDAGAVALGRGGTSAAENCDLYMTRNVFKLKPKLDSTQVVRLQIPYLPVEKT